MLFFGGNADARIPHSDLEGDGLVGQGRIGDSTRGASRRERGRQTRLDGNIALRGELDGVVDEVDHDLSDANGIAEDPGGHGGVDRVGQIDMLSRRLHGEQVQRLLDADGEVQGLLLQVHLARLDLRKIEDVVDDGQQRIAADADGVHAVALFAGEGSFQQQARHPDDPVHRRADLVAHRGEELRLGARGSVGFLLGPAQVILSFHPSGDVHQEGDEVLDGPGGVAHGLEVEMKVETPAAPRMADEVRVERGGPLQRAPQAGDRGRIGVGADQQLREGLVGHLGQIEPEQADKTIVDPLETTSGIGDGNKVIGAAGNQRELTRRRLAGLERLFGSAAFLVLGHQAGVGLLGCSAAHQGCAGEMGDGPEQPGQPDPEGGDQLWEESAAALQGDGRRSEADPDALIEEIEGRLLAQILPNGTGGKLLEDPMIVDIDCDCVEVGEMQAILHGLDQPGIRKLPEEHLLVGADRPGQKHAGQKTLAAKRQRSETGECRPAGFPHLLDELPAQRVLIVIVLEQVFVALLGKNPAGVPGRINPGE